MRRVIALLSAVALIAALVPTSTLAAAPTTSWIVTLRAGNDSEALAAPLVRQQGGELRHVYRHALNGFAFRGPEAAARALRANPRVASVVADAPVWLVGEQANPTWGLDRIDQRNLPLDQTYVYDTTGAGVTAYIIDTGIRTTHNEFGGRATSGYDAIDGGTADDCHGHGTHVAGTVGGTVYGVAKGVSLVAVRVLDCNGSGSTSSVVAGIDWVTGHHTGANPAVANMSLGGGPDSAIDTAVRNSIADGVSYAIAAGNGDFLGRARDACNYSPARVAEAMTISATNSSDTKASWANYGNCVDWFAPGVSITSAWSTSNTATSTISGTSMATPHTAGVAALYLQTDTDATPAQVRDALYNATTKGVVSSSNTANNHLLFNLNTGGGGGGGSGTGTLSGTVTDASTAAPIGGATVSIGGTLTGTTDGNGNYSITGVPVDTYDVTVTATGYGSSTKSATVAEDAITDLDFALTPSSTGDGGSMHVADLDRSSGNNGGTWTANVTITVRDGTNAAVTNATVTGSWSNGASGTSTCFTNGSGQCTVSKSSIAKRTGSVTFTVSSVAHATKTYDSAQNSDPDGDSNGTTITLFKP